jgi:hypothetical protein
MATMRRWTEWDTAMAISTAVLMALAVVLTALAACDLQPCDFAAFADAAAVGAFLRGRWPALRPAPPQSAPPGPRDEPEPEAEEVKAGLNARLGAPPLISSGLSTADDSLDHHVSIGEPVRGVPASGGVTTA